MATSQHIKASRTQILNSFPSNTFGNDGDIVCVSIKGKGSYLCIKQKGRWFSTNRLNDLRLIDKPKLEKLSADKLSIKNLTLTKDELDVSKGDLTIDVEGDIELNADGDIELNTGRKVTIKDGSDSHFHFDCDGTLFQILDDTNENDYFMIRVAAEGATAITTVDADTVVAHLTLQPDGDLILDPVSQKIIINATDGLYFDGGGDTYIKEGGTDRLDFYVGGTLLLQIQEAAVNATHINCHLSINAASKLWFDGSVLGHTYIQESSNDVLDFYVGADKMLALDEANDKITMGATNWVAGTVSGGTVTEFSAANSSYAGMILGYTDIGLDETTATYDLTTSYAVPTSEFKVAFVIPPSGNVEIEIQVMFDVGSSNVGDLYAGLSDNATYNAVDDFHEVELFDAMSRGAIRVIRHSWTLTGLTGGAAEEIWVGFKSSSTSGTPHLQWGGDATAKFPDFIMKSTALPATIAT